MPLNTLKPSISLFHEIKWYNAGFDLVAGVDEAGRGPLAGPVVACAVVLPKGLMIEGVNDSKKLSPKRREALAAVIKEKAVTCAVSVVDAETIDCINILQATFLAMTRAINALALKPDIAIIDGPYAPKPIKGVLYECLPHGDALCHSIAAASIIAKVERDAIMDKTHERFPLYGFNRHKGYGTRAHREALSLHGPCREHRRSFKWKI